MSMIYWAIIGLGAFVAIWIIFVIPSERRHHERKLEIIRKRLEMHLEQANAGSGDSADDTDNNEERS